MMNSVFHELGSGRCDRQKAKTVLEAALQKFPEKRQEIGNALSSLERVKA